MARIVGILLVAPDGVCVAELKGDSSVSGMQIYYNST